MVQNAGEGEAEILGSELHIPEVWGKGGGGGISSLNILPLLFSPQLSCEKPPPPQMGVAKMVSSVSHLLFAESHILFRDSLKLLLPD